MANMACIWHECEECWETSCGNAFIINDGTPEENGFRFCTYCGEEVEQVLAEPLDNDDY